MENNFTYKDQDDLFLSHIYFVTIIIDETNPKTVGVASIIIITIIWQRHLKIKLLRMLCNQIITREAVGFADDRESQYKWL